MKSYKDLEIYQLSYDLAVKIHKMSLKLPNYELYEKGSQLRRFLKGDNLLYRRRLWSKKIQGRIRQVLSLCSCLM
jgi:hypothetical protein